MFEILDLAKERIRFGEIENAIELLTENYPFDRQLITISSDFYHDGQANNSDPNWLAKIRDRLLTLIDVFYKDAVDDKIYCYIIASVKSKVRTIVGVPFEKVEPDRYDDFEKEKWKPFTKESNIQEILRRFKESHGYQLEEKYLDGVQDDRVFAEIDDNKRRIIAIIDLLSQDSDNKDISKRFDTEETAGVLAPTCITFYSSSELTKIVDSNFDSIFKTLKIKVSQKGLPYYHFKFNHVEQFNQHLLYILLEKFTVKKQIETNSPIRKHKFRFN